MEDPLDGQDFQNRAKKIQPVHQSICNGLNFSLICQKKLYFLRVFIRGNPHCICILHQISRPL